MSELQKKAIYLCAKEHRLERDDIVVMYNDIDDIAGLDFCCDWDMVDLNPFDVLIGTPPCNYYSKANYRRETSYVAQVTKDIFPRMLQKFLSTGKPFIIENVDNINLMPFVKDSKQVFWFRSNHHIYVSNRFFMLPQVFYPCMHKSSLPYGHRDNNPSVNFWLNYFLDRYLDNSLVCLGEYAGLLLS